MVPYTKTSSIIDMPPTISNSPFRINQNKSRRNLFNPNSMGSLIKTVPLYHGTSLASKTPKKVKNTRKTRFSNGSMPGDAFSMNLPKSNVSQTSVAIPGAYVVPPTNVANTYQRINYNRRRKRKTQRRL